MFNNPRLANTIANVVLLATIVALLAGGGYWLFLQPMFNINHVVLWPKQGNVLKHVSPASIQSTIAGQIKGNFFTVDLSALKKQIESAPWVRSVDISRVWPDSLLLRVEEHETYAKWNENQLINTWGEIFTANRDELEKDIPYPQYNGPDGSEKLMVQRAGELATLFSRIGLQVKEVTLSDRYAWQVILSNGLSLILGRDGGAEGVDPLGGQQEAVNFSKNTRRFVQAWPVLLKRTYGRQVIKADLRYTKGFAITLAPVTIPNKEKK